jgi:hypothetical protein
LILLRQTKDKPVIRKRVFYVSFLLTGLSLFGLLTNISTTLSALDWILVSSCYLTVSFVLWWTQFQGNKLLKILGILAMIFIFGLGYLLGTIGALGVAFAVGEYETDTERWLGDGLIYKESSLGNAISDYRGKRVEIYKTISWMPIVEWRIQKKEYFNFITYGNKLNIDYQPTENKIYLSTSSLTGKDRHTERWADTLILGQ